MDRPRTAGPKWPKGFSVPYGIMLRKCMVLLAGMGGTSCSGSGWVLQAGTVGGVHHLLFTYYYLFFCHIMSYAFISIHKLFFPPDSLPHPREGWGRVNEWLCGDLLPAGLNHNRGKNKHHSLSCLITLHEYIEYI